MGSVLTGIMKTDGADERLVDTKRAAQILGFAADTLTYWRCKRKGPPFVRLGTSIRYQVSELWQWVDQQRSGGGRGAL